MSAIATQQRLQQVLADKKACAAAKIPKQLLEEERRLKLMLELAGQPNPSVPAVPREDNRCPLAVSHDEVVSAKDALRTALGAAMLADAEYIAGTQKVAARHAGRVHLKAMARSAVV